jgi:hypothetical protein
VHIIGVIIKRYSKIVDDGNYLKGLLNSIYHKMENFILDQNSLNENNGSTQVPNLIDVFRGKNGIGMSICSKIETNYFFGFKKRQLKNGTTDLQCKNFRRRDGSCR